MSRPMMRCGHSANGWAMQDGGKVPACVICLGVNADATTVDGTPPDLSKRMAKCDCGETLPSSSGLAFFRHNPNAATDAFYCGCRGWN
jgi:hypothetical protein